MNFIVLIVIIIIIIIVIINFIIIIIIIIITIITYPCHYHYYYHCSKSILLYVQCWWHAVESLWSTNLLSLQWEICLNLTIILLSLTIYLEVSCRLSLVFFGNRKTTLSTWYFSPLLVTGGNETFNAWMQRMWNLLWLFKLNFP